VLKLGCSPLLFIEPGLKVDGRYYRDVPLKQQMLPVMRRIAGDTYVFQQDSAPAHRAGDTVQLLQQEMPEFIASDLWPPNSPDLNGATENAGVEITGVDRTGGKCRSGKSKSR